jgi:hypothetical protein
MDQIKVSCFTARFTAWFTVGGFDFDRHNRLRPIAVQHNITGSQTI